MLGRKLVSFVQFTSFYCSKFTLMTSKKKCSVVLRYCAVRNASQTQEILSDHMSCPFCQKTLFKSEHLEAHLRRFHHKQITNKLKADPLQTYQKIFGTNTKSIHNDFIRWPDGIVVTFETGSYKDGLWYDFKNGKGGGPLEAIMYVHNVSYIEAIKIAKLISQGISAEYEYVKDAESDNQKKMELNMKRIETACSIWNISGPLGNTLGEKYLTEHRKIPSYIIP